MSKGFFSLEIVRKKPEASLVPKCGLCGLYKTCQSPKMPVSGKGRKKILIVGEAPGAGEDQKGIQFIGQSGQLLEKTLAKFGVRMREDCWIDNALRCRPQENIIKDKKSIEYCRPNLLKAIEELKPKVIILLGGSAVKSLIGWLWKEDVGLISKWDGWQIPSQRLNAWICPTWHPAFILRTDYGSQKENEVRKLLFETHLKAACKLDDRPWDDTYFPFEKTIAILDSDKAAKTLPNFTCNTTNRPIAFDYETDRLKPDAEGSRIVSCAVSDGITTIAYPWHGKAIAAATQELLQSDIPKIASNLKFEERWTRKEFGHGVTNWQWDTMIAAHVLDNRPEITGLKFQAFVLLGQESYDDHVKPYLKSKSSNEPNRIKEVELSQLLKYNGLDALLEWKVAEIQQRQMKERSK